MTRPAGLHLLRQAQDDEGVPASRAGGVEDAGWAESRGGQGLWSSPQLVLAGDPFLGPRCRGTRGRPRSPLTALLRNPALETGFLCHPIASELGRSLLTDRDGSGIV